MNNPLFKPRTAPLSEDEERDITRMLAEAYQRSEAAQKSTPAPLIARLSSLIITANDGAAPSLDEATPSVASRQSGKTPPHSDRPLPHRSDSPP